MAKPQRRQQHDVESHSTLTPPQSPMLVEDDPAPQTEPDAALSPPIRVPPELLGVDQAPLPDPLPLTVPPPFPYSPQQYLTLQPILVFSVIVYVLLLIMVAGVLAVAEGFH
jgi:hypothetical protein